MVVEDMIYLIHVKEMAKNVSLSLSSEVELRFVDLEQDPPKVSSSRMLFTFCKILMSYPKDASFTFWMKNFTFLFQMTTLEDKNLLGMQFISIQKLFSLYFPLEGMRNDLLPPDRTELRADTKSLSEPINSRSSFLMDLSTCVHDTKVTLPTING